MGRAGVLQEIRRMRFEALLDRHERGGWSQIEAAEMLGVGERTFRRWRDRLRDEGPEGLIDRRIGKPSSRRAAEDEILRMLGLYREHYADFTVKHFHEQLVKRPKTGQLDALSTACSAPLWLCIFHVGLRIPAHRLGGGATASPPPLH